MIPKPKTHKRLKLLFVIIILLAVLVAIGLLWYRSELGAPSSANLQKVFVIQPQESTLAIADRLEQNGLIKNSFAFRLFLKEKGIAGKLQAGDFKLNTNMTANAVADVLVHGVLDVWVTFPEGWRAQEMAALLNQKLGIPVADFIKVAKEGYMFPDTYLLPRDANAQDVVRILSANFTKKITDTSLKPSNGLSVNDSIILASIIEREAKDGPEERGMIAGVLLNRIRIGMALQVDAAVQYSLGKPGDWWPKLTQDDLKTNSDFNTYKFIGLPPAPISNPGLISIKAAFNPIANDYLYYLHDKNGQIHFAKTLDEHNANVAKYIY